MGKLITLFLVIFGSSLSLAQSVPPAYSLVKEWTPSRYVLMAGISDCKTEKPYYSQYLQYLEQISKVQDVIYFTEPLCQPYFSSKIDTSHITFIGINLDSMWIRDYAPLWLSNAYGEYVLASFPYGANFFGNRAKDDGFAAYLADYTDIPIVLDFPRKQPQYYFDGGNLMVDDEGVCYTSLKADDFPADVRKDLLKRLNCKDAVILEPIAKDLTGHVDMFLKLLPGKKALLASYTSSPDKETMERNKEILLAHGFTVTEVPHISVDGFTNWSYVNAVILKDQAFIPQYGFPVADLTAMEAFKSLGYQVHAIPADKIMQEHGSLHCITNFAY